MYAVFEDGSRQYRAEVGGLVTIDYREIEVGKTIELDKVLLVNNGTDSTIGKPLVAGAKVKSTQSWHTRRVHNFIQ